MVRTARSYCSSYKSYLCPRIFFFKQKTAYDIGLGIPAEPLFRSLVASLPLIITSILSFISGGLATKSKQIKQLIRNGRSASLQRTFKKSFTSFSQDRKSVVKGKSVDLVGRGTSRIKQRKKWTRSAT